jgi:hypothetical protein
MKLTITLVDRVAERARPLAALRRQARVVELNSNDDGLRVHGSGMTVNSVLCGPDADVSAVVDPIVKVVDAPPLASDLSGCISTRRRTARKS